MATVLGEICRVPICVAVTLCRELAPPIGGSPWERLASFLLLERRYSACLSLNQGCSFNLKPFEVAEIVIRQQPAERLAAPEDSQTPGKQTVLIRTPYITTCTM